MSIRSNKFFVFEHTTPDKQSGIGIVVLDMMENKKGEDYIWNIQFYNLCCSWLCPYKRDQRTVLAIKYIFMDAKDLKRLIKLVDNSI